jgi:hypothetical protein
MQFFFWHDESTLRLVAYLFTNVLAGDFLTSIKWAMLVWSACIHEQDCHRATKVGWCRPSLHIEQSGSETPKFHHLRKLCYMNAFKSSFSIFTTHLCHPSSSHFHYSFTKLIQWSRTRKWTNGSSREWSLFLDCQIWYLWWIPMVRFENYFFGSCIINVKKTFCVHDRVEVN